MKGEPSTAFFPLDFFLAKLNKNSSLSWTLHYANKDSSRIGISTSFVRLKGLSESCGMLLSPYLVLCAHKEDFTLEMVPLFFVWKESHWAWKLPFHVLITGS